jgi:general stress protein 26
MTSNAMPRTDQPQHLVEVLRDFDSAILITRTERGDLRGRPMALAQVEPGADIYFATSLTTETAREIEADPRVAVTVQGKLKFASVSGKAHLMRDRALIDKLWREGWKLWFPEGKDDPNLCLIRFDADEGEYWDTSGTRGIKFALRAAGAYVRGERLDEQAPSDNAKVKLH